MAHHNKEMKIDIGIQLISSQRYLDEATVLTKRHNKQYKVCVVLIEIGNKSFGVILDGHHSLKAAILDNAEPDFEILDWFMITDQYYDLEEWLMDYKVDSEYYDYLTGKNIESYLKELYQKYCDSE